MRCHWIHVHDPHDWTPLVADPDEPRVLHLFGEQIRCPGLREFAVDAVGWYCTACRHRVGQHSLIDDTALMGCREPGCDCRTVHP